MSSILCNNRSEPRYFPDQETPYCLYPKETLAEFKIIRHVMTCVSILVAVLCTYIVIASRSLTRVYSYMLVVLLLVWTSIDVVIQWVVDPVFLFPELGVYRRSPVLNLPITAGASVALAQSLVMFALVVYMALFLYRHQVLVAVGSRFKIPDKARIVFLIVLSIPYLAGGVEFYIACVPAIPRFQTWLSEEFFSTGLIAARVDFYLIDRVWYMTLIFDGHFAWMFVTAIATHTYSILRNIKSMSLKSQTLHRVLIRSLIIQALTPVVFIILPMTAVLLTHVFVINQYSAFINELKILPFDVLLVVISFHATSHSIALIGTTPAFRAKLTQMLSVFGWRTPTEPLVQLAGGQASFTASSVAPNIMTNFRLFSLSLQIAFSAMGPLAYSTTFLNTPVQEFRAYLNESYNNQLTTGEYDSMWNLTQNIWLVGFLIGMVLSPLINDRFGRRIGLLSGNISNLCMAILQWASVHLYLPSLLLIGRFFSSIAAAIAFQCIVLYLQEFPPSSKRGICSYTSDIAFSFFSFVGMTLGTKQLLGDNLSLLTAVLIVLCTVSVLLTLRFHESPKYLLLKKRDDVAALASVRFFHGTDDSESTKRFIEELRAEGGEDDSAAHSLSDVVEIFRDPALRKTVLLGLAAVEMTIPLWTLLFNSTDLLLDLNASMFVAQWTSSGMVVGYFIGTIIGMFLIDRLGRRALLIPCSALSVTCTVAVVVAFYMKPIVSHQIVDYRKPFLSHIAHAEFIAVAAMLFNGLVFGTGITSIGWFIAPELSPQRYRSLIQSIVAVLNTVQSAAFTFAVMPLYRTFGAWIFLVLFCLVCTMCNVFLYLELPETKGRTISEITQEVRNGTQMRKPKLTNNEL